MSLHSYEPRTPLDLAEKYWSAIAEALYHPEEYDDDEWLSEVSELTRVYDLLNSVSPSTPEEGTRLERLLQEIRQASREFGFSWSKRD